MTAVCELCRAPVPASQGRESGKRGRPRRGCGAAPPRFCSDNCSFFISRRINAARKRALKKGLAFEINAAYMRCLFDMRCSVTGLRMRVGAPPGLTQSDPLSPSIDRIDSKQGYVMGNVRWVCWAFNRFKADWDDVTARTVLVRMAEGVLRN
jgi:hypothetical protein